MTELPEIHPTSSEIQQFLKIFITDPTLVKGAQAMLNSWRAANQLGMTSLLLDQSTKDLQTLISIENNSLKKRNT